MIGVQLVLKHGLVLPAAALVGRLLLVLDHKFGQAPTVVSYACNGLL